MGVVHLAEARGPGGFEKLVVVKELKAELADDPVYCAMFLDEARLAAQLSHRHIVQTNEVGCEGGRYFMALELLEGGSLHQIRTKLGLRAMPLHLGLRVLVAVLDALDHAHDLTDGSGSPLGVVHRDVSPQNVFLTFDGDVKLIDFGVAKSKDRRSAAVTRVGVVKGSVPYMSPDHVDGSTIDRRADVFAVGVMLREMLAGERLWGDAGDLDVLRSLIARELPVLPESADVSTELRAIADRAMAPRRADRFPTAAAMRDALEAHLEDVDPRGSLDDLGPWLGRALADERAAFRALVRKSRAAKAATTPAKSAPTSTAKPPAKSTAHVWLPSCELSTRYSGPPLLPALAPPLPAAAKRTANQSRARFVGAGLLLAAALGLAALGASHPTSAAHAARTASPLDRVPHAVDDPVTASIHTSVAAEAPEAPAAPDVAVDPETFASDPAPASRVPAAVLRERLPPNPYDGLE
jgi:serine/threonine-protein kinase